MKYIKYKPYQLLFLLSLLVLNIFLQSNTYAGNANALLWRIDKVGVESSYIMATMHSEDPRVLKLPNHYNAIFSQSKSFTAEIDLSVDNNMAVAKIMMLPENKKLKQIIGDDLFNQSVLLLKDFSIPKHVVNKLKPWAVLMTLSYPKPKTGLFLDKVLYDKARKLKIKSYGLETVEEQIAIFDNISYSHQTILLRDSMKQYPNFDVQLKELKELYLAGDLDGLKKFNNDIMLKGNYRVASLFMDKLINKRNITMVTRMKPRLLEGAAFIAVGALHLPGKAGILQLLRQQHYQITPVQ